MLLPCPWVQPHRAGTYRGRGGVLFLPKGLVHRHEFPCGSLEVSLGDAWDKQSQQQGNLLEQGPVPVPSMAKSPRDAASAPRARHPQNEGETAPPEPWELQSWGTPSPTQSPVPGGPRPPRCRDVPWRTCGAPGAVEWAPLSSRGCQAPLSLLPAGVWFCRTASHSPAALAWLS